MNLIEHDRRKVSPALLDRLADVLQVDRAAIAGGRDVALLEDLRAAAARLSPQPIELERADEFVSRFPGWASLLSAQYARAQTLERAIEALNDRMTHDPHLSQSLHEVLSSLASVRATAAILAETEDIDPDWAARFHRNLHDDSERLAAGAEALVAYLDSGTAIREQGIATPQEEVEDWLAGRGWGLSDVEAAAGLAEEIDMLASSAARSLARAHVKRAGADAQLLPEADFAVALAAVGPDPFALAERFQVEPQVVMRRLAARTDLNAGLVVCDTSGTLTFRKPTAGFPLPRFGAACSLWPLYAALGRPFLAIESLVEVPDHNGRHHRAFAWASIRNPAGLRGPELREAAMLILPTDRTTGRALPVGSTCRVCPRDACPGRREPTILSAS
jgi:hypothetical protein